MMKVMLRSYTAHPEDICGLASRTCVSEDPLEIGPDDLEKSLASAIKSGHLSVLEHASFTFYIEGISRACSHQLVRHRMASYAQQSQRYVDMSGCFDYVTPPEIARNDSAKAYYDRNMRAILNLYETLVEVFYIKPEDARYILPNACTTNITVTMNARELLHFFDVRCCERAQWEIREVAERMLAEVTKVAPALFREAGPQCIRLGYCPEARGCGRYPSKDDLHSSYWKSLPGDGEPKEADE